MSHVTNLSKLFRCTRIIYHKCYYIIHYFVDYDNLHFWQLIKFDF